MSERRETPGEGSTETRTATRTKPRARLRRPNLYKVLLHNDDFTPMEFVVAILEIVFRRSESEAQAIMLLAHTRGAAVAGVFAHEIAEAKATRVAELSRGAQFPLLCTLEPEGAPEGDADGQ